MIRRLFSAAALAIQTLFSPRSPGWPAVERAHLSKEPRCQWCGGAATLQVHHIEPFHLFPAKELDPTNLITLCMDPARECHYRRGHKGLSWLVYEPDIRKLCDEHRKHRDVMDVGD